MSSFPLGPWTIDTVLHEARDAERVVGLGGNEVALLLHLHQTGRPSSRRQILVDVFGYAEAAKSRAVDMAVRRIRQKLETDPSRPELLLSKPGLGVFLSTPSSGARESESPPRRHANSIPYIASPLLPRPEHLSAVRDLFAQGWRVVSIVGPGGIGKTRLGLEVARAWEGEVLYVPTGAHTTADDLCRALIASCSASNDVPVERLFKHRSNPLVVFDEAELGWKAMRDLVPRIPVPVLLTSRRALGLAGEAVFEVSPLSPQEGFAFVRSRLPASRWHRELGRETIERLVQSLDGHPMALELALGQPQNMDDLLRDLDEGATEVLPRLDGTLQRSWDALAPSEQVTLQHLALFSGAFHRDQVVDWLGAIDLTTLVEASLVAAEGEDWRLLSPIRVFVRRTEADWPALRASFEGWLIRHARSMTEQMLRDCPRFLHRWRPLVPDLQRAIENADPATAASTAPHLAVFFTAQGNHEQCSRVLIRGLSQGVPDPLLHAWSASAFRDRADEHLRISASGETLEARCAHVANLIQRRERVTYDDVREITGVQPGQRMVACVLELWALWLGYNNTEPPLRALLVSAEPFNGLLSRIHSLLVVHAWKRSPQAALQQALLAKEAARYSRAQGLWMSTFAIASVQAVLDPPAVLDALREQLQECRAGGWDVWAHGTLGYLQLIEALCGEPLVEHEDLERVIASPNPATTSRLQAAAYLRGQRENAAYDALAALDVRPATRLEAAIWAHHRRGHDVTPR